ncbi:hypothetical protein EV363DRAFT_1178272 [Boletus edulis]|nr:hypothetical protein EV363DRAFT_1178272 [Boletus edulis]
MVIIPTSTVRTKRGFGHQVQFFHSAGKVYDVGQTFLDRFGMDTYSFFHRSNLYYPFASHNDWQVANYLLQSGLSMAKIDEYLKLNLVHFFFGDRTFATHSRIIASGRYGLFPFHFRLRRGCKVALSSCQRPYFSLSNSGGDPEGLRLMERSPEVVDQLRG